jgi:hypothetical protein
LPPGLEIFFRLSAFNFEVSSTFNFDWRVFNFGETGKGFAGDCFFAIFVLVGLTFTGFETSVFLSGFTLSLLIFVFFAFFTTTSGVFLAFKASAVCFFASIFFALFGRAGSASFLVFTVSTFFSIFGAF